VITSIHTGSAEQVYETLYCARGQVENLIKLRKAQLASDRTRWLIRRLVPTLTRGLYDDLSPLGE